jgi:hypothetical protein
VVAQDGFLTNDSHFVKGISSGGTDKSCVCYIPNASVTTSLTSEVQLQVSGEARSRAGATHME